MVSVPLQEVTSALEQNLLPETCHPRKFRVSQISTPMGSCSVSLNSVFLTPAQLCGVGDPTPGPHSEGQK